MLEFASGQLQVTPQFRHLNAQLLLTRQVGLLCASLGSFRHLSWGGGGDAGLLRLQYLHTLFSTSELDGKLVNSGLQVISCRLRSNQFFTNRTQASYQIIDPLLALLMFVLPAQRGFLGFFDLIVQRPLGGLQFGFKRFDTLLQTTAALGVSVFTLVQDGLQVRIKRVKSTALVP